jgi:hypothetical protein
MAIPHSRTFSFTNKPNIQGSCLDTSILCVSSQLTQCMPPTMSRRKWRKVVAKITNQVHPCDRPRSLQQYHVLTGFAI